MHTSVMTNLFVDTTKKRPIICIIVFYFLVQNNTRSSSGKDKTEKQTGTQLSKKEDEEKRGDP